VRGDFPATRTVIVSRVLIAVVIVLAALVGGTGVSLAAIVVLGLIVAALTGVYVAWDRVGRAPRVLLAVQFGADVVFITLVVYFSGGLASPFKLLYFLPVIVGSARLGFRVGTAIAAGSVAGYLVLSVVGPRSWEYLARSGAVAEMATLVVALLLVAALVGHLAGTLRKMTEELVDARAELRTARARMSNVIGSMSSGLVLVDADGRVVYLNRAGESILGISENDARGRDYRVVFADIPAFCDHIATALEAGRSESRTEFYVKRPGGRSIPVGLSTSIIGRESGDDSGVVGIFQDLTEARRLEERLRHEDRLAALGEFAAGLAHEIRNPLNAIKGSIDLLKDGVKPTGDDAKLIGLVARESDRLTNLVLDVLEFGRMESGHRESVGLARLLEEVAATAKTHPAYGPHAELSVEAPRDVEVMASPDELRRAFLNLTINGLEALGGEGKVRLLLVPRDDFEAHGLEGRGDYRVAVVVEDTGGGIPADMRNEIFQPFKTTKKGGTGLGLSIVDRIVQSHGGRITVVSESGRGTKFIVYLRQ